jgi:hypothetical protein
MNTRRLFVNCLNEASLKCSFSVVVQFLEVKRRLQTTTDAAMVEIDKLPLCRLHEGLEGGCFCPIAGNPGHTIADLIADIRRNLVSAMFEQMKLWPEVDRLSTPDDKVNVVFVPKHKQ